MFNPFKKSSPIQIETAGSPDLARAFNDFGFRLFEELCKENSGQSVFISPFGIASALILVLCGSQGETKAALTEALGLRKWNDSEINEQCRMILPSLSAADAHVRLAVANSLWVRDRFPIISVYQKTVEEFFRAQVSSLDFGRPEAADIVNRWVAQATNGKISAIAAPPIDPLQVLLLINAAYFKGDWKKPFEPELTKKRPYFRRDKNEIHCQMMCNGGRFGYFETNGLQAIILPYGKNNRFDMCVFLPNDMAAFVARLDGEQWRDWLGKMKPREGTILLPKFKFDYAVDLASPLQKLGMGIPFSKDADFGGISPEPLSISQVLHKSYADVNEEGTEAAAVTYMSLTTMSLNRLPRPEPFFMEVNRPFFFVIRDNLDGKILFMGHVKEPTGY